MLKLVLISLAVSVWFSAVAGETWSDCTIGPGITTSHWVRLWSDYGCKGQSWTYHYKRKGGAEGCCMNVPGNFNDKVSSFEVQHKFEDYWIFGGHDCTNKLSNTVHVNEFGGCYNLYPEDNDKVVSLQPFQTFNG